MQRASDERHYDVVDLSDTSTVHDVAEVLAADLLQPKWLIYSRLSLDYAHASDRQYLLPQHVNLQFQHSHLRVRKLGLHRV